MMIYHEQHKCKDNKYKYMMVAEECFFCFHVVRVVLLSFLCEPCEEPPLLSLVVYCCSSCRFLLSVPSLARNIFVQIGYAELKVRGKKNVPIQRLTLLFRVVHVVVYKKTQKRRSNLRLSDAH